MERPRLPTRNDPEDARMRISDDLRCCPFCGAGAVIGEDSDGYAIVFCSECRATMTFNIFINQGFGRPLLASDRAEMVVAWNRRVGQ